MLTLQVCMQFRKIIFHSCHRLQKYFYNENFLQIYGNVCVSIQYMYKVDYSVP